MFSGSNLSMVSTPTLLNIPFNWKFKMAAVKRKFPYLGLYLKRNKNFKGYYHTVGHADARKCRATLNALLTTMVADKPEVVITWVIY
jgi:hypothetical protein